MISNEQEHFVKNHINPEFFDISKVVNYLKIHDFVGEEIFDLALKPQNKRNISMVEDGFGFQTMDVDTFVKRVPFYFYQPDFNKNQRGDLVSLLCGKMNNDRDLNFEEIYIAVFVNPKWINFSI